MLRDFLNSAPIAETVHVEGNVILQRMKLSTDDLLNIRERGELVTEQNKNKLYELEVNGLTIATGRVIKKRGEFYFKVIAMNREEQI
ncbi:MAG: hypothetical protein JEY91_09555 [Spirochaetaceae bacterium]|nr:hypothetical protein [Spirochaetaceae bacterium]